MNSHEWALLLQPLAAIAGVWLAYRNEINKRYPRESWADRVHREYQAKRTTHARREEG